MGKSISRARYGVVALDIGNYCLEQIFRIDSVVLLSRQKAFPLLTPFDALFPRYEIVKIPDTFVAFDLKSLPQFMLNKEFGRNKSVIKEEDILGQHVDENEYFLNIGRKVSWLLTWVLNIPVHPLTHMTVYEEQLNGKDFYDDYLPYLLASEPADITSVDAIADKISRNHSRPSIKEKRFLPVKDMAAFEALFKCVSKLNKKDVVSFWRASNAYREGLQCMGSELYGSPRTDRISYAFIFFMTCVEAMINCPKCRKQIKDERCTNCKQEMPNVKCKGCGYGLDVSITNKVNTFLFEFSEELRNIICAIDKEWYENLCSAEVDLLKKIKAYKNRSKIVHNGFLHHLESGFPTIWSSSDEGTIGLLHMLNRKIRRGTDKWLKQKTSLPYTGVL